MPWKLKKTKQGFFVVNSDTGVKKNHKPIPHERALRYLKALYANYKGA